MKSHIASNSNMGRMTHAVTWEWGRNRGSWLDLRSVLGERNGEFISTGDLRVAEKSRIKYYERERAEGRFKNLLPELAIPLFARWDAQEMIRELRAGARHQCPAGHFHDHDECPVCPLVLQWQSFRF
jgi:hypothetical protein